MFTPSEMAELQGDAESLMVDTYAAFSPGEQSTNADGIKVPSWTPEGTTIGKAQAPSAQAGDVTGRTVQIGGATFVVIAGGLHIPISQYLNEDGTLRLKRGWEFQCTAVGAATDPAQLGRRWHVIDVPVKAYATARRLDVAQVPSLTLT